MTPVAVAGDPLEAMVKSVLTGLRKPSTEGGAVSYTLKSRPVVRVGAAF